jgi:Zn-dependent peptidase ImmA (M78 family)
MQGLSLAELREKMGNIVTIAAISKYENGQSLASSTVIVALADALNTTAEFFFRDFDVELKRVRFRKLTKVPAKDTASIQERAKDYFEKYFQIEEITSARKTYEAILESTLTPGHIPDPEELAEIVRAKWGIGNDPIPNVHALLEDNGIKVWYPDECHPDFDGFSADTDHGPVAVVSNNIGAPRKRMTGLHELAHILVEPFKLPEKEEESLVKEFTSAILLPRAALLDALGTFRKKIEFEELFAIKRRFGISVAGIMMRARKLGIINESVCTSFFRFGAGKKWRMARKEPDDDSLARVFPETHNRFRTLVFRAIAEELITVSQAAEFLACPETEIRRTLTKFDEKVIL